MLRNILILLFTLITTPIFAGGYLIYLPPDNRQHNIRGSCVFASITNCLRASGQWDKAEKFWSKYRGPGNTGNTKHRLEEAGIKYKMIYHCDEEAIIETLSSGRMLAIAWGGHHFVNIVGKIDGKAYIVDNESPKRYKIQDWSTFLSYHKRAGGWGVVILDGRVPKSREQIDLKGYESKFEKID